MTFGMLSRYRIWPSWPIWLGSRTPSWAFATACPPWWGESVRWQIGRSALDVERWAFRRLKSCRGGGGGGYYGGGGGADNDGGGGGSSFVDSSKTTNFSHHQATSHQCDASNNGCITISW